MTLSTLCLPDEIVAPHEPTRFSLRFSIRSGALIALIIQRFEGLFSLIYLKNSLLMILFLPFFLSSRTTFGFLTDYYQINAGIPTTQKGLYPKMLELFVCLRNRKATRKNPVAMKAVVKRIKFFSFKILNYSKKGRIRIDSSKQHINAVGTRPNQHHCFHAWASKKNELFRIFFKEP